MNLTALVALVRPRQWVKNGFVLAPLVFAGAFLELDALASAILATVLFCIGSSAVYVVNDMCDADKDRKHHIKSKRPLASGAVTRRQAGVLLGVLYLLLAAASLLQANVMIVIFA